MKTMKIGIIKKQDYIKRTTAIAAGRHIPKKGEPKVWFESLDSMRQVLSERNQALLGAIAKNEPRSIKELEELTGRKSANLSRTLKTMAMYGIVDLVKDGRKVRPVANATDFSVEFGVNTSWMAAGWGDLASCTKPASPPALNR